MRHIRIKCQDKTIYDLNIVDQKYSKMENLAKEWGMTNMGQYCKYSMQAILESHCPDQVAVG